MLEKSDQIVKKKKKIVTLWLRPKAEAFKKPIKEIYHRKFYK